MAVWLCSSIMGTKWRWGMDEVTVVGAGLAGSEAALQLADRGLDVHLLEMRPVRQTAVHHTGLACELVCSNSLKSLEPTSAAGTLKYELAALGSRVLSAAFSARVPAGGALAVDRDRFSASVTEALERHPRIRFERKVVTDIEPFVNGSAPCIIATGPLTDGVLAESIARVLGDEGLAFFDAAAPIVEADTLDLGKLFRQSRYDAHGTADYLNAPFTREEYDRFIAALVAAERVIMRDFESKELFSACQPVEEIARTSADALRHGALKPVGLLDPRTGRRPWAALQLRAENDSTTAYNLVGFQTNLRFGEQDRVFRMIPGLEHAEFSRHGVMHRNTFIDTPHHLSRTLALPDAPHVRFAGQVCGTEGYAEAVASGLFAALCTYADLVGAPAPRLPKETVFGSLLDYATDPRTRRYQPMHVNYGIMTPLDRRVRRKRDRYLAYATRARAAIDGFVEARRDLRILSYPGSGEEVSCLTLT
jgi:methylenetetrahydrofolate--tRNA-(uracil-5-)-methyltransferase